MDYHTWLLLAASVGGGSPQVVPISPGIPRNTSSLCTASLTFKLTIDLFKIDALIYFI
ncbi:hypothetical protein DSO57_1034444, partial [Entomophthora muscae]